MRKNPYANLCLAAQALRREFEGVRTPLAPATGVAAFLYTHQLANVFRVLTDLRVRHLLADEVGLGKTVQALMILNALRYQRQDLRALVIVPRRSRHSVAGRDSDSCPLGSYREEYGVRGGPIHPIGLGGPTQKDRGRWPALLVTGGHRSRPLPSARRR